MKMEPMTEDEANAPLPEATDLSTVSDEDLDKALEGYEGETEPMDVLVGELAPDTQEEPAPVVEEPEVEIEMKPAEEETPVEEPAAEETPVEEQPKENGASDLDEIKSMVELSELRNQKSEAELNRWRHLADKNAGKVAHLEQLMKARELSRTNAPVDDLSGEPFDVAPYPGVDDQARVASPELQSELDEIRTERVQRALEKETISFRDRHREFFTQMKDQGDEVRAAFMEDFNAELAARADEFKDSLTGSDAKLASVTARTAYDSALIEARIKLTERSLNAAREAKGKRQQELIEQKRGTAPTTGQSAPPPPDATDDTPLHRMGDKEFNEIFRRTRFR